MLRINSVNCSSVAPLAGAWIEIPTRSGSHAREFLSLPSRERGLKFVDVLDVVIKCFKVAPLAGAWIEIVDGANASAVVYSRSPRGSVD